MKLLELNPQVPNDLEAIALLRATVWSNKLGHNCFSQGMWTDVHDFHSFHWGVFDAQDELIAAARLCIHEKVTEFPDFSEIRQLTKELELPSPIGMMTRLVVSPNFEKMGIARQLDQIRIEKAQKLGAKTIILQVPDYRRKSIEKLGFECVGKALDETFKGQINIDFFLSVKFL